MNLPPQKFRELVLQLLYSCEYHQEAPEELLKLVAGEVAVAKSHVSRAYERALAIWKMASQLDEKIQSVSHSYNFERIQSIEKSILRLGVYELFEDPEIPAKVAISEAMRLAKKFATPEAVAFVNALLDTLYQSEESTLDHPD